MFEVSDVTGHEGQASNEGARRNQHVGLSDWPTPALTASPQASGGQGDLGVDGHDRGRTSLRSRASHS